MINIILRLLIVLLPFVIVTNGWESFRGVKEVLFQLGAIAIFAAAFFDTRQKEYLNRYITYFLIYLGFLFLRFYGIPYFMGMEVAPDEYRTLINYGCLIPTFNVLLGFIIVKIIVERLDKKYLDSIIRLSCIITFIVSLHIIGQSFDIIQVYGRLTKSAALLQKDPTVLKYWLSSNKAIGFIGNPMLAASFIAISAQFNLYFRKRINYIFYVIGFIAVCLTRSSMPIMSYCICAFVFFLIYKKSVAWIVAGSVLLGIGVAFFINNSGWINENLFTFSDRPAVWQKTIAIWWKQPYTGGGLGSFKGNNIIVGTTQWWQAHNEPLQIMQEMGLVGLGLSLLLLFDFFKRIILRNRKVVACALVVCCGCINSLMNFPLHIACTVFILILGFTFKEILEKEDSLTVVQENC